MKEKIINAYINRLTKNDIITFATKNGIILDNQELDYIYQTIKQSSNDILNNPTYFLNNAKEKLKPATYQKLYELYTIYYPMLYH